MTARLDGAALPYVDGLLNLVVVEDPGDVPAAEIKRVTAPGGTIFVRAMTSPIPLPLSTLASIRSNRSRKN